MGTNPPSCADSFAFLSSTPLVVQQLPAHRLLVVIPVRRECCSWRCDSSARVTYFTAPTSTDLQPARPGVDFLELHGAVIFEGGQQRAQLAVEILSALVDARNEPGDSATASRRAFAVVLDAPIKVSPTARASAEIIIEPTSASKSISIPSPSTISMSYLALWILIAMGLVVVVACCWFRGRGCSLARRGRAFQYKVLLLPRRDSGASEGFVSANGSPVNKCGMGRRTIRRVGSFKKWRNATERRKSCALNHVVPEAEGPERARAAGDKRETDRGSSEDASGDSESERDLRKHLAAIQSTSPE